MPCWRHNKIHGFSGSFQNASQGERYRFRIFWASLLNHKVGKKGHMPPPGYLYERSDVSGDTRLRGRPTIVALDLGAALARHVVGFVDVRT